MILTNEQPTPDAGIPRDRWKRALVPSPFPGGPLTAHQRPSGLGNILDDRFGLEQWMQGTTAEGLIRTPQLVEEGRDVLAGGGTWKDLRGIVERAQAAAGANDARNTGTQLHEYIETHNLGGTPKVAPEHQAKFDAYRRCMDAHRIEPKLIERFVVWPDRLIAGSADMYGTIDGRMCVLDLKTGKADPSKKSMVSFSIQMCAYAHATHMWDGTNAEPLPEIDKTKAYLIWLPSDQDDRCELIEVDLVKGLRWLDIAMEVRDAHKDRAAAHKVPATTKPLPSRAKVTEIDTSPPRRTVRIGDLRRRLEKIVTQGVATKDEIGAVMKEAGLPPLSKPDAQTDETVDNWEGIVATFEMALEPEDLEQRTGEMISRLGRLPVDLVAMARAEAAKLDPRPPNLTTGRATALDLDRIDAIVEPLELQHAERVAQVTQALSELGEDEAAQVVAWCCEQRNEMFADTIPIESLDNLEAERVVALAWSYTVSAHVPDPDLALGQSFARLHGLPVPDSLSDLENDRVLTALVMHKQHNA